MVPALAHRTVLRRTAALVLLAAFIFTVVVGCRSGSGSTSYRTLRTVASFTGTGDGQTAHFVTNGDWVLSWACEPPTFQVPFGLGISIMQGGDLVMGPVITTCETPSSAGNFAVHQSGEQWLVVGTSDSGGWVLYVNVPQSDTGAELVAPLPTAVLPTPTDMPPPVATLPPPVATLPLTFSGQGTASYNSNRFTAPVRWHDTARCVNPPTVMTAPYSLIVKVDASLDATGSAILRVGELLDVSCDGTTVDSNTVDSGGLPSGVYGWDVATGGDWTITVLPE